MRLLDPCGWPRVFLGTAAGTLLCVSVALFIDSYNFPNLTDEALRRAILVNIAVPASLAAPLLFVLLWKMKQLAVAHRDLQVIAATDTLTSVLNRGAFTMLVEAYLEKASEEARFRTGALLVVDVDHFKTINDRFGHQTGDAALISIATSIKKAVRGGDMVGRMGGEEFGVFLPGADPRQALDVAERIRVTVAASTFGHSNGARVTVSVGGVTFGNATSFAQLYGAADRLLYDAKKAGRNRVIVKPALAAAGPLPSGGVITIQ